MSALALRRVSARRAWKRADGRTVAITGKGTRTMRAIDTKVVNLRTWSSSTSSGKQLRKPLRPHRAAARRESLYSYDVVPARRSRSCPFHSHRGEEEMFFISPWHGHAALRNETRKLRAGDVICCPTGGPETAHQIVNDSSEELAYLSVSTMMPVEICEYPDSGKVGAFGGGMRHLTKVADAVDYWVGED